MEDINKFIDFIKQKNNEINKIWKTLDNLVWNSEGFEIEDLINEIEKIEELKIEIEEVVEEFELKLKEEK